MVRELFVMAREHAPSIIFMDEVDSIGSARTENSGGGGDSEVQRTMLELLNQLDGFEASNKIKVDGYAGWGFVTRAALAASAAVWCLIYGSGPASGSTEWTFRAMLPEQSASGSITCTTCLQSAAGL